MEPLRNVLRRWIDGIERRHVIDASVVEFLRQVLEFLSGADEIDRDGIAIDATTLRCEIRLDFVRVAMQRLRDAAIFAQVVRGFEASFDSDREGTWSRFAVRGSRSAVGLFRTKHSADHRLAH